MADDKLLQNVDLTTPLPKSPEETDQERDTAISPVNTAVGAALGLHAAAALAPKSEENLGLEMPRFQTSETNAAQLFKSRQAPPAPGSMGDRLQRALMAKNLAEGVTSPLFDKLVESRGAGVALMTLAHNAEAAADTTSGNTSWDTATSNQDITQPTSAPIAMDKAQQARQAVTGEFSDLAAATEGGGGALAGAARVAGAEARRRAGEEKDRVNMALSNAQMLHEQMLVHKLGEDQVNEQAKSGKQAEQMALLAPKAELKAEGKTSDELGQMIRDKKIDPTRDMVFLTGRADMGRDKNGRSVYSVVTPGGPMTVDENAAKYINGNMPWQKIPVDTQMTAQQFYGLWQQAQGIQASMQAAQKFNDDLASKDKEAKLTDNDQRFFAKTAAMQAVSKYTSHIEDPYGAVKAYAALKLQAATDPKLAEELGPGWEEQFMHAWGNGSVENFKNMQVAYAKDYDKAQTKIKDDLNEKNAISNPSGTMALAKSEMDSLTPIVTEAQKVLNDPKATKADKDEAQGRLADANTRMQYAKKMHDIAKDTETNKAEEEKLKQEGKKGFQGNLDATTPEEYLASLKPNEAALVREIGTGKIVMKRLDYLATRQPEVLEAVAKAFPDFDSSKAGAYPGLYEDFTKGKTAIALNAGGTAMGHLKELFDLNTNASHIPHTPAWTAYQNKADTLATELAKFYGDATIPAISAIKETLTSTLPGNREAAIKTQAQSMNDKLESFEYQWQKGAPSKAYEAPLPGISVAQKRAFAALNSEYAEAHPELQVGGQNQSATPKNATPNLAPGKSADGVTVWHMADGSIQDAQGNKYDPNTGKRQ